MPIYPWRIMPKEPEPEEPMQTTEQGYEIPIPDRDDVMDALRRVARPKSVNGKGSPK